MEKDCLVFKVMLVKNKKVGITLLIDDALANRLGGEKVLNNLMQSPEGLDLKNAIRSFVYRIDDRLDFNSDL